MQAQPEHLWSTRVKHAPITCIPVPCCPGVACIFLTALLSYPTVGVSYDHGKKCGWCPGIITILQPGRSMRVSRLVFAPALKDFIDYKVLVREVSCTLLCP
jgi:hypothetical protein